MAIHKWYERSSVGAIHTCIEISRCPTPPMTSAMRPLSSSAAPLVCRTRHVAEQHPARVMMGSPEQ